MGHQRTQGGFTIAEVLVTLGILSLFLMLFFNTYMLSFSQKNATILRAAANDIALSNLRKITQRSDIPTTARPDTICDDTNNGVTNRNNVQRNTALKDSIAGTYIASGTFADPTSSPDGVPWQGSSLAAESLDESTLPKLPSTTIQKLSVVYPKGCTLPMPAKIISSVTYQSGNREETVVYVSYVTNN